MVTIGQENVEILLAAIAAKTPTPGGGAVAAITSALAAALGQMVVNYSCSKPSLANHKELHEEALRTLADLQGSALRLADADAEAFAHLSDLWDLPADDVRRQAEWNDAVAAAIDAPRQIMGASMATLRLTERLSGKTVRNLRSDLAITALLAEAGARAAACNVRINIPLLNDKAQAAELEAEVVGVLQQAARTCSAVQEACRT